MALTTGRSSLTAKLKGLNPKSGLGVLQMAKVIYSYGVDGGTAATLVPKKNFEFPDNSVIVGGTINSTTALASAGANVTIGTTAGSTSSAILGTTAHTSFSTDALINAVPVFATPVKLTAKGKVSISFSGAITAGIVEIVLYFYVANN